MKTPDVPLPGLLAATGLLAVTEFATRRPRAWLVDRLGPRNALDELEAKRYVFCADDAGRGWARVEWAEGSEEPSELVDHFQPRPGEVLDRRTRQALADVAGDLEAPACPNAALAFSLLFDVLGTSPGPDVVRRFAEGVLPADPLAAAAAGEALAGEEIAEWLEADCVVDHGPDNYLALADAEGLIRRFLRARRGL